MRRTWLRWSVSWVPSCASSTQTQDAQWSVGTVGAGSSPLQGWHESQCPLARWHVIAEDREALCPACKTATAPHHCHRRLPPVPQGFVAYSWVGGRAFLQISSLFYGMLVQIWWGAVRGSSGHLAEHFLPKKNSGQRQLTKEIIRGFL
jgi:hypothetical protein